MAFTGQALGQWCTFSHQQPDLASVWPMCSSAGVRAHLICWQWWGEPTSRPQSRLLVDMSLFSCMLPGSTSSVGLRMTGSLNGWGQKRTLEDMWKKTQHGHKAHLPKGWNKVGRPDGDSGQWAIHASVSWKSKNSGFRQGSVALLVNFSHKLELAFS